VCNAHVPALVREIASDFVVPKAVVLHVTSDYFLRDFACFSAFISRQFDAFLEGTFLS
jgi:hypothetical protein